MSKVIVVGAGAAGCVAAAYAAKNGNDVLLLERSNLRQTRENVNVLKIRMV